MIATERIVATTSQIDPSYLLRGANVLAYQMHMDPVVHMQSTRVRNPAPIAIVQPFCMAIAAVSRD